MTGKETLGNDIYHDFEESSSNPLKQAGEEGPDDEESSVLDVV